MESPRPSDLRVSRSDGVERIPFVNRLEASVSATCYIRRETRVSKVCKRRGRSLGLNSDTAGDVY